MMVRYISPGKLLLQNFCHQKNVLLICSNKICQSLLNLLYQVKSSIFSAVKSAGHLVVKHCSLGKARVLANTDQPENGRKIVCVVSCR